MEKETFGSQIYGKTIGEVWLKLIKLIIEEGEMIPDEKRNRLALQCMSVKTETQDLPDALIEKYGNKEYIDELIEMHFGNGKMHDFDVVPSFSDGAKSYYARLKQSNFVDYAVERLSLIPESKKVVMVFPEWKDYKKVRRNHYDDYLPCMVAVQFRMLKQTDGSWKMNTIFFARSLDGFQKANGNLVALVMLAKKIVERLKNVSIGTLQGFISDVHIYQECLEDAKKTIQRYENDRN